MEASLINMSGGLTGGGVIEWSVAASYSTRVATSTGSMKRYVSGLGDRFMTPGEVFAAQGEIEPSAGRWRRPSRWAIPLTARRVIYNFRKKIMGGLLT